MLLFYFGVGTLIAAGVLYRYRPKPIYFLILNLISLLTAFVVIKTSGYTLKQMTTPLMSWWFTLPLFPPISLLMQGFLMFSRFAKPKSQQEQLAEMERQEAKRQAQLSRQANRRRETTGQKAMIRLGSRIKGDRFPKHLGIETKDGWLTLSEDVLDLHLFVLGTTGAGKSETIKRLVYEVFSATDRNVYLVDGKGDEGLANDIRGLAHQFGRGIAPVFKLGFEKGGAIYDGFRGSPTDIYNRLCALIGTTEAEGGAAYYADVNRDLLQLVCYSPLGAPRSFEEVRQRLNKKWMMEAYKDDPTELEAIDELDERSLQGLLYRIRPMAREFGRCIGEEGFALEETACAIFSMRVQSVGDTAQRLLSFFVADLLDYIGKRQEHPAVLIIDEFGQFGNDNITSLLSLSRSSKLAIILATQDVASLKDEKTKKLILANTRTKVLMATDYPEDIAQLAGTSLQVESSMQLNEGDLTGMGSARVQHTFRVDPNESARLKAGEAFLIRQRYAAKIQIRRIEAVSHIQPQQEEIRQKPKHEPKKTKSKKRPRSLN